MSRSAVLKIHDFRILFGSRVLTSLALQAQAVGVGWFIYQLSHSAMTLGLVGLTEAVPAIGFAFLAGHVVDTHRPALIYRMCLFILLVNTAVIWLSSTQWLDVDSSLRLALLFASVFVSGMVRSFSGPSVFALISHVVPRPLLSEASAWSTWAFQVATILGPSLAGFLYESKGASIALALPPLAISAAFISVTFFTHDARSMRSQHRREPFFASVLSGIEFVSKQKTLLASMSLDMFSVLFGGAVAVLPVFSDQVLHAGSSGLGLLRAAPSVGSGLVALVLAIRPLRVISGQTLLIVVAGFGLSTLGFALSTKFIFAFLFLACTGGFDGVSMVIRNTILQLLTPPEMRGRVSSLGSIFITSSNEIGAFESGVAAQALGLVPSILFGGVMTLVVVAATLWIAPELRRTRLQPHAEPGTR